MLITEVGLCLWVVHIWQCVYILFVLPHCGSQVTPHVTILEFYFFSKAHRYPSFICSNSPTVFYCLST